MQERLEVSTQKLLLVQGQPLRSLKAGLERLLPAGGPHPGMCLSPPFPLKPKACELGEGGPGKALQIVAGSLWAKLSERERRLA